MSRKGSLPKSPSADKSKSSTGPSREAAALAESPSENEGSESMSKEAPTEQAVHGAAAQPEAPVESKGNEAGMSLEITLDQVMGEAAAAEDGPTLENEGSVGMLMETTLDQVTEAVPGPSTQPEDPSGGVEASLEVCIRICCPRVMQLPEAGWLPFLTINCPSGALLEIFPHRPYLCPNLFQDGSEDASGLPVETSQPPPEDEPSASEQGSGSVAAKEVGEEAQVAMEEGEKEAESGDAEAEGQIQAVRELLEESGLQGGTEGGGWGLEAEISIKEIGSSSAATTSRAFQKNQIPSATRRVVSSEPNTRPGTAQEPYRPAQSARPLPVRFSP